MPAVLDVATSPDIIPAVSPDRTGKLEIADASPRPPIVVSPVPVTVPEDEVGVPVIDDVMSSAIRHREPVIIHVDEVGSAIEINSGTSGDVDAYPDIRTCLGHGLCCKCTGEADNQQNLFFHGILLFSC
jgi:hypothetical protein